MAEDTFKGIPQTLDSPITQGAAVVLHDTNDVNASIPRAIYVGTGGTVKMTLMTGDVVTLLSVPSGTLLPIRPLIVWATGTTALNLIAFW